MVHAQLLRRARAGFRALPVALLFLAPVACETDGIPSQAAQSTEPPNSASSDWLPEDVDGDWRGWSFPTGPIGIPVQLTLGFEQLGEDPEDLALTRYSFPAGGWGTINYFNWLSEYTLRFEPEGRLLLDTVMLTTDSFGNLLEERIYKDLQMAPDGQTLAGEEIIQLTTWPNGFPNYRIQSYWLTLERLD